MDLASLSWIILICGIKLCTGNQNSDFVEFITSSTSATKSLEIDVDEEFSGYSASDSISGNEVVEEMNAIAHVTTKCLENLNFCSKEEILYLLQHGPDATNLLLRDVKSTQQSCLLDVKEKCFLDKLTGELFLKINEVLDSKLLIMKNGLIEELSSMKFNKSKQIYE